MALNVLTGHPLQPVQAVAAALRQKQEMDQGSIAQQNKQNAAAKAKDAEIEGKVDEHLRRIKLIDADAEQRFIAMNIAVERMELAQVDEDMYVPQWYLIGHPVVVSTPALKTLPCMYTCAVPRSSLGVVCVRLLWVGRCAVPMHLVACPQCLPLVTLSLSDAGPGRFGGQ